MRFSTQSTHPSFKQSILYCTGYLLGYGLLLLIVISIAVFFQFLLGYEMTAMDSWLFDHGWEMNALVSIINLSIISKFLYLKSDDRYPFRTLLINEIRKPPRNVIVMLFAFFLSYGILLKLQLNAELTSIDIPKLILGYFLANVCLMSHFLFVSSLQTFLPVRYSLNVLRLLIISVGLYFIVHLIFPQAQALSFVHLFIFFLILHLQICRLKLSDLLFMSVFCFCPILILTGFDPLWGNQYSPWIYDGEYERVFFLSIGIICTAYVGYPLLKRQK